MAEKPVVKDDLRAARTARGLRQIDLVSAVGGTATLWSNVENGISELPEDLRQPLASFYGVKRKTLNRWIANSRTRVAAGGTQSSRSTT